MHYCNSPLFFPVCCASWSLRAHGVIEQERRSMSTATEARKKELLACRGPVEKALVEHRWREEVSSLMETTHDLLQCVANDLREASFSAASSASVNSSSGASSLSYGSADLGKIIEEELFSCPKGRGGDKVLLIASKDSNCTESTGHNCIFQIYVVRTQKKKKRRSLSKRKKRLREEMELSLENGVIYEQGSSFTLTVDELKRRTGEEDEAWTEDETAGAGCGWKKEEVSGAAWNEQENKDRKEEVEDLFADWLSLLRRQRRAEEEQREINEVFWSISLGQAEEEESNRRRKRGRRGSGRSSSSAMSLSQLLEGLPFEDRPDIFADRCEILEGSAAATGARSQEGRRRKKKVRRWTEQKAEEQMGYWDIFSEWKGNLEEEEERAVRRRRGRGDAKRRKKKRSRAPSKRKETEIESTQQQLPRRVRVFKKVQHKEKKKATPKHVADFSAFSLVDPDPEDFFLDSLGFLFRAEESGGESSAFTARRRSRDDFEQDEDDSGIALRSPKRFKVVQQQQQQQPRGSFDLITSAIEQKIREAFAAADYDADDDDDDDGDYNDYDDEELPERLIAKSTEEFCSLRDEVRRLRKDIKRRLSDPDSEAVAFSEWMWNLEELVGRRVDDDETAEDGEEAEDIMNDWRHHLEEEEETPRRAAAAKLDSKHYYVTKSNNNDSFWSCDKQKFWRLGGARRCAGAAAGAGAASRRKAGNITQPAPKGRKRRM